MDLCKMVTEECHVVSFGTRSAAAAAVALDLAAVLACARDNTSSMTAVAPAPTVRAPLLLYWMWKRREKRCRKARGGTMTTCEQDSQQTAGGCGDGKRGRE